MLSGLSAPTSGAAYIFSSSIMTQMNAIRRDMGNCFQHDVLYPTLTVSQHLHMFAGLRGLRRREASAAVTAVLEQVGLMDKLHVQSMALSGGMKRKLSLVGAFASHFGCTELSSFHIGLGAVRTTEHRPDRKSASALLGRANK